ncbi:hypothetical protein FRC04_004596 [Tulasnella sp. 424]|nr:hypothetical protein FRC04_004596 [Tulasnella sp. 424]KAG8964137.1 hypothetical protein FRC05_004291 [Tulasnella sp. 425]
MAAEVHRIAEQGFGEGTNALYDAYRPTYPAEQLDFIQSHLSNPQGPLNVLELGAGTGIFTRCLLAHKTFGPAVGQLHAVEPSAGMREQFTRTVVDERVSCKDGVFERTGEDDGWADLVVVAQAWHWCPDFDRALTEFSRVLKPGGVVTLIWNLEDMDVAWVAANRKAYEAYEQGTPQFRLGLWRKMYEVPAIRFFSRQEEREVTWTLPTTVDRVVERVFTKSYVAVLDQDEKDKLRTAIKANTEKGEGRTWLDKEQGIFEYPHKNLVVLLTKS